jgi:hypothetical protein
MNAAQFWTLTRGDRADSSCWPWPRCKNLNGYGLVTFEGRLRIAHRVAWRLTHGDYPGQAYVLHHCDNRPCCNPGHLFLGDAKTNALDAMSKGRHSTLERHGQARLTRTKAQEIRALFATGGLSKAELGRRYGVSRTAIYNVISGCTWTPTNSEVV